MPPFSLSPSRIGRFFFHDCERFLRFDATPKERRSVEGVPPVDAKKSPVTEAILEGGYEWEEEVVRRLGESLYMAPGAGPVRDRVFPKDETTRVLGELRPGEYLYQGTLKAPASFLGRYGIGPEAATFSACRADLIQAVLVDGRTRLRVLDVKASDTLKASHRVQVALYALMMRDILAGSGCPHEVDLSKGGIWLHEAEEPELFDLSLVIPVLESFLRDRLPKILASPAEEVPWHLHFRCEWCEYFQHCRKEAEETDSVSRLPFLSVPARRLLRTAPWNPERPVNTLADLEATLASGGEPFKGLGALEGREGQMARAAQALRTGKIVPHGASSVAMPVAEHVRYALTLQSEPLSGQIYAAGFRRTFGTAVFGRASDEFVDVASGRSDCLRMARSFITALHEDFARISAFNVGKGFGQFQTVQCYVFDGYEDTLLTDLLLAHVDDGEVGPRALELLFHYQSAPLAAEETHPVSHVPYPVVVLTRAIAELCALPAPVAVHLSAASSELRNPNPSFHVPYQADPRFSFELSNAMKSDAIFDAWRGVPGAGLSVVDEVKRRLRALTSMVDGLRDQVKERLFAWPPKFVLSASTSFDHPELSRVHFVLGWERFTSILEARSARARPLGERLNDGAAIQATRLESGAWRAENPIDPGGVEESDFKNWLMTPWGDEGDRAQMSYNELGVRNAFVPPIGGWLAAITSVASRDGGGCEVTVEFSPGAKNQAPGVGDQVLLQRRHSDSLTARLQGRLAAIDAEPEHPYLALIRAPVDYAGRPLGTAGWSESLVKAAEKTRFVGAQRAAFEHLAASPLTLVWGPPGTGKTWFLSRALVALVAARRAAGQSARVVVTSFTNAAIENLLVAIEAARHEADLGDLTVAKLGETKAERSRLLTSLDPELAGETLTGDAFIVGGTVYKVRAATDAGLPAADWLIVDEGSQMKWGEFGLATVAMGHETRLCIAGDDLQLPPIMSGTYPEPTDGLPGLESSVFAYLRARDDRASPFTFQLEASWRMNATLAQFPADTLYGPSFRPATPELASRRLVLATAREPTSELIEHLLDPAFPLVLCVLDGVQATTENPVEAGLVTDIALVLRERMVRRRDDGTPERVFPESKAGDAAFWDEGLFVVSPHRAHNRLIRRRLADAREWEAPVFVDTVDKMQGQQAEAVIVSYGVSDADQALAEAEFIYSRNRLNVAITRARSKCIVLLSRPLLEPGFDALGCQSTAEGLGFMHALLSFARQGDSRSFELPRTSGVGTRARVEVFRAGLHG